MIWPASRGPTSGTRERGTDEWSVRARVNVAAVELKQFPDLPDGFRPEIARVGKLLGATRTGMSVYELPPGQAIGPYHYEDPEEEWLLVVDGQPTLRHPGRGRARAVGRRLFPAGPDGAHMVRNDTTRRPAW